MKTDSGADFKNNFKLDYFKETSAKTGNNVKEIFIEAAKVLYADWLKFKDGSSMFKSDGNTTFQPYSAKIKLPSKGSEKKESGCVCSV